jgi:hypothetical protein
MCGRFAIPLDVTIGGSSERVQAELVSGTYFPLLGVTPALGRVFHARDEVAPGGHPLVVLSFRYRRDRFRSDASGLERRKSPCASRWAPRGGG